VQWNSAGQKGKRARQDQAGLETTAQEVVACRTQTQAAGQSGQVAMRTRREGAVRDQTWVTSNPRERQGSRGTQSRLDRGGHPAKISISRLFQPMAPSYLHDCLLSVWSVCVCLSPLALSSALAVCHSVWSVLVCPSVSFSVRPSFFPLPSFWWVGVALSP